jgi:3-dehydroquinate synthase
MGGSSCIIDDSSPTPALGGVPEVCTQQIATALLVKKSYIEDDEFDRGKRQLLNYGHEFGHALEATTHFSVPHGLAVAIGIDFANRLSQRRGRATEAFVARVNEVVRNLISDLPVPTVRWVDLLHHLGQDKKKQVGKYLTVVVAHSFGDLEKLTDVTPEEAEEVAARLEHIRITAGRRRDHELGPFERAPLTSPRRKVARPRFRTDAR